MNQDTLTGYMIILMLIGLMTVIKWIIKLLKYIQKKFKNSLNSKTKYKNVKTQSYPSKQYNKKLDDSLEKNNYYESTYYKQNLESYLAVIEDKGKYGEYLIYEYLRYYEDSGAKFLFNCYLNKENGQTTEIDVIMIHNSGIFVFESKNYSGWIFGHEKDTYWTQTLFKGKGQPAEKERFFNPIKQNELHISCLRKILGNEIPIHSIVVFSERCTFKELTIESSTAYVITRHVLNRTVDQIVQQNRIEANTCNIENIYNALFPYTQLSMQEKQQHIKNIQSSHNK